MTIAIAVTPAMMIVTRAAVMMRVGIPQVGGFGQLVTGLTPTRIEGQNAKIASFRST